MCPQGVLSLSLSLLLQGWLLQGPWLGLWEELSFPTQPSPACLSHPGQGELSAGWEKQLETP